MLGGWTVTMRVRQISNSNYDLNLLIEAIFSRDPVQSRPTFVHDPLLTQHLIYRSKLCERKIRF